MYVCIQYSFLLRLRLFVNQCVALGGLVQKKIFASSINQIIKMKIHEHNKAQGIVNELL